MMKATAGALLLARSDYLLADSSIPILGYGVGHPQVDPAYVTNGFIGIRPGPNHGVRHSLHQLSDYEPMRPRREPAMQSLLRLMQIHYRHNVITRSGRSSQAGKHGAPEYAHCPKLR
jgi:hypothetical protein